jgi:hypothetical protein
MHASSLLAVVMRDIEGSSGSFYQKSEKKKRDFATWVMQ